MTPVEIYQGGERINSLGEGETHLDRRNGYEVVIAGREEGFDINRMGQLSMHISFPNSVALDSGVVAIASGSPNIEDINF